MLNKEQALDLVRRFIPSKLETEQWYINVKPAIKAMLLYGSVAKGVNRPDSDIDILIILPLSIEEKFTVGEYYYEFEKQQVNIVLRSIERLRTIAQDNKDNFQKEIFRDCEIISEADSEVRELLNELL